MNLSPIDKVLWAAALIGHAALFCVLLLRGRWRKFPVFTALIAFDTVLACVLMLIYRYGTVHSYARVYWSSSVVDFVLQIALVFEIARVVLRPTGTWVRDAHKYFLLWGTAGAVLAILLAWAVTPPGLHSWDLWEERSSLFTSLATSELVLVMATTATRLGLGWKNHVMSLGMGLAAWSLIAVAVDSIESYLGMGQDFTVLDHIRVVTYCLALGYWSVRFWANEPERRPISRELQEQIIALHRKVAYNASRFE